MPDINFNLPTVATTYTDFPEQVIENIDAALQQLSVGLPTTNPTAANVPTGAIRWDINLNRWRKWDGSQYVNLTSTYNFNANISATMLDMGDSSDSNGGTNAVLLGASDDLRIFHDSSNSYIRDFSGTGNLKITTNQLDITKNNNTEFMATFVQDGAVTLFHNNTARIATSNSGATITGTLTTTAAINTQGGNLNLSNTSSTNSIEVGLGQTGNNFAFIDLIGDATHTDFGLRLIRGDSGVGLGPNTPSGLLHKGTGQLQINAQNEGKIAFKTRGTTRMYIDQDGNTGIGTTTPSKIFDIRSTGSPDVIIRTSAATSNDAILRFRGARTSGGTDINQIIFETNDTGGGNYAAGSRLGSIICGKQSNNTTKGFFDFRLNNTAITDGSLGAANASKLYIRPSNEVGISTTNPQRLLELSSADQTSIIRLHSTDTTLQTDNRVGMIEFSTDDASASGIGAFIEAIASGNQGQTDLRFATGTAGSAAETARFDKDGRLLIGHSEQRKSRVGTSNIQPDLQIHSNSQGAMSITRYSNSTSSGRLHIQKARGTKDSPLVAVDGDTLCDFTMSGYDGSNFTNGARITAEINGTVGSNAMPTDLKFQLRDDSGNFNTNYVMTHDRFFGIIKGSPAVPLHVKQLTDNNGCTRFEDSGDTNSHVTIDVTDHLTSFTARRNASHGSIRFQSNNGTATSENMRIIQNNGVAIGTTTLHTNDKLSVAGGRISTNDFIIAGRGEGGVALTHNDGGGNGNLCFNHVNQTPEQNGKSGRISVNTDNTGGIAIMNLALDHAAVLNNSNPTSTVLSLHRGAREDLDSAYNGDTTVVGQVRADGTTSNNFPAYSFINNPEMGMMRIADNVLGFVTAGNARMRIASNSFKFEQGNDSTFPSVDQVGVNNTQKGVTIQPRDGILNLSGEGVYILATNANRNGAGVIISMRKNGTQQGSIQNTSGAGVTYNSASDYRLKEDAVEITDGIEKIKQLKPYNFQWKKEKIKDIGFFAHELQFICSQAVTGTKDEVDSDNNPIYQQVDQSKLIPFLVSAVKSLIAKVEVLEAA